MGFETPEEGYLAKIVVPAGTKNVPIGKLVCIIVENQADVAAFKNFQDGAGPAAAPAAPAAAPAPPPAAAPAPPPPPAAAPQAPAPAPQAAAKAPPSPPQPPPKPAAAAPPAKGGDQDQRVYASPMAKKLAEAQQLRLEGNLLDGNEKLLILI